MASNKILTDLEVKGKLTISDVSNASSDPDKFLSINGSQLVQYRTGSQLRGDIGAGTGSGTVTSVGLTIDEDQAISISNTPITSSGNIGLNFEGDAAQVILGSGELGTYFTGTTTPSNTQTFTNKSGNISQWTNDSGYITSSSIPSVGNGTLTMTTNTGLDGGATFTANQSGNSSFAVTLDLTEITLGVGLDATATGLSLDLSEFTDMTAGMTGTDEFIVLDSGSERRKAANEIGLSIFNNNAGFVTSSGVTSVGLTSQGDALQITNTPITSTGNLTINFQGDTGDYINGEGDLISFPSIPQGDITNVSTTSPITGGGSSGSVTIAHANSGVNAGQYSRATVTVNATGHVTSIFGNSDAQGVTSVATGNGISGGTITSTGTLTVGAGNGLSQSSTGLLMSGTYSGNYAITGNLSVDGQNIFGMGISTGTWYGDLSSNGYTRETGLNMTGGSEFVVVSKNGQGSVLVDGAYLAYESANGFFGSYNSAYGNLTGIQATDASTLTVKQLDGGTASLVVSSGNITLSGTGRIQGIDTVSASTDAANKAYVDASVPSVGNGTFTVSGSSGLSGSGSMTANQSGNSSASLTNTDKGSSQSIYKNFTASSGGTATANSNNDTLTIAAGTNITTVRSGDTITINATNDGQGVTSIATTNGITGGTITSTGTLQVDSTVVRTTGDQSVGGIKTFTTDVFISGDTKDLVISNTAETKAGIVFTDAQAGTGQAAAIKFDCSTETLDFFMNDESAERMSINTAGALIINGGNIELGGTGRIQGVDTVSSGTDAANKTYVDNAISGVPQGTVTSVATTFPVQGGTITGSGTISVKTPENGDWWNGGVTKVGTDGVMEIGKYIDMHAADAATSDFDIRLTASTGSLNVSGDIVIGGGDITLSGTGRIQGVDTVSASTDAANKSYVDSAVAGVPQGTVTGTGTSGQLAIFNGSSSITSNNGLLEVSTGVLYANSQFQVKGVQVADYTVSGDTDTGLGSFDGANGVSLVSKGKKEITVKEGDITFNTYDSTSVATTGSLNPNQSNQAPTQDTLAQLCVDPSGNVVRGEQEGTWTFTRAQLNATLGNTLIAAPGANKAIIVTESDWMVKYSATGAVSGNQSFDVRQANIVQTNANISTLPGARINEIINAAQGTPTNPSYGFCARDIPLTTRTYKTNVATTLNKKTNDQLPAGVISISVKLKYRIFNADTF